MAAVSVKWPMDNLKHMEVKRKVMGVQFGYVFRCELLTLLSRYQTLYSSSSCPFLSKDINFILKVELGTSFSKEDGS